MGRPGLARAPHSVSNAARRVSPTASVATRGRVGPNVAALPRRGRYTTLFSNGGMDMRHLAILLVGSLGACASHEAPPAASAESVQAATATPSTGPSFAPVGSDAMAAAPADARRPGTTP